MEKKVIRFVRNVRARLRELHIVDKLLKMAVAGLLTAALISVFALFVPFYYAVFAAVIVTAICILAGFLWGFINTPTMLKSALMADSKGHQEKFSTAYENVDKQDDFSLMQRRDAVKEMEQFKIRREFPIILSKKLIGGLLLFAVLFAAISSIDTPAKQKAFLSHDSKKAAEEVKKQIEKVEKEFDKKSYEGADTKEVAKAINTAKKELKTAKTRQEVAKAAKRLSRKLEQMAKKTNNKELGRKMSEQAEKLNKKVEKQQDELMKAAKEALEKAEKGSDKEKKEAAKKMAAMASALGNEELAKAAEQYSRENFSDSSYNNMKQALSKALKNSNQNNSLENAKASTASGNASAKVDPNATVNIKQQGNVSGNAANGAAAGQGSGNNGGASGNGTNGFGNSGAGWNHGSKNGSERDAITNNKVTVPDGTLGNDDNLTGKANENGSAVKQQSEHGLTWSGNKVDYGTVSGSYKDKAYKQVDGASYPASMKEKIRNYFSDLE